MAKKSFVSNTLAFSGATLISRILGYARDATIAYFFGANPFTDAFFIAWRLPNTFRQLLGEGSFNAAFIPIYTDEELKSKKSAKFLINSLFTYYTLILALLTFFVIIFAPYFVQLLAPGFKGTEAFDKTVELIRIVFPYLILVGWVSFFMALLNTKDRFFLPALTPALLNLSFITFAFLFSNTLGIYALAVGALVGGVLQVLILIPTILKENFLVKPTLKFHPKIKLTIKKMLPAFASFGVSQFSFIIDTIIASFLLGGAISYLYYANRIFQLPMGVFAIGLGNALLVSLSKHYSQKDMKAFNRDLNNGLLLSVFISLPATAGMIVIGLEIIDLLLVRGAFSTKDAVMTNWALIGYSIGLVGYATSRPLKSAFFAKGDTITPLYATIFGLTVGIISAVILGFVLKLGVFGLALASSLIGFSTTLFLYIKSDFEIDIKLITRSFFKVLISVAIMSIAIYIFKILVPFLIIKVFGSIILGITIYLTVNYVLKEESLNIFLSLFLKKFRKKS